MKVRQVVWSVFIPMALLILAAGFLWGRVASQETQPEEALVLNPLVTSRISYQGLLTESGSPVNGSRNMVFSLYNTSNCSGAALQSITRNGVQVTDGLFNVALDVNQNHFNGQDLRLRVTVGSTTLGCEEILPAPYALYSNMALNADLLDGKDSTEFALESHTHRSRQADKVSQLISSTSFTEVLKVDLALPDKCTGSAPVDQWNVLVIASGYVSSAAASSLARLGLSLNDASDITVGTLTNASISTGDHAWKPFSIHWLYTGVDSGTHVIRLLAEKFASGDANYTVWWSRMTVQSMGYSCGTAVLQPEQVPYDVNDVNMQPYGDPTGP